MKRTLNVPMMDGSDKTYIPLDSYLALEAEVDALREALVALVDVQPYLHPNRTKAVKWEDKRQAALNLAAAALDSRP